MPIAKQVGVTTLTTPSDREVLITRVVEAPRRLIFEAWTSCEHLPHWLLGPGGWTMPICEIDLRPGGTQRFVWRRDNGTEMEIKGVIREVTPPERFVATESWGKDWPETINTLVLTEEQGITTIALTMLYPSKEARDNALKNGMKDGIDQSFVRLDEYARRMH